MNRSIIIYLVLIPVVKLINPSHTILLTPLKSNEEIVFSLKPNYSSTFQIQSNGNIKNRYIKKNDSLICTYSISDFQNGILFVRVIDSMNKIYKCKISIHTPIEFIDEEHSFIPHSYHYASDDFLIGDYEISYIEFKDFNPLIECDNSFSIKQIVSPKYRGLDTVNAKLIIHQPPNFFDYLTYSNNFKGYVFDLILKLKNNTIFHYFKDELYYQIGTFEISNIPFKGFYKTSKIYFPINKGILNSDITIKYFVGEYIINVRYKLFFNQSAIKKLYDIRIYG